MQPHSPHLPEALSWQGGWPTGVGGLGLGGREPLGWSWVTVPEPRVSGAMQDGLSRPFISYCRRQWYGPVAKSRDATGVCTLALRLLQGILGK